MVGLGEIIILTAMLIVAILSAIVLWLQGTAYTKHQNELKDWNTTVSDGLDQLEEEI